MKVPKVKVFTTQLLSSSVVAAGHGGSLNSQLLERSRQKVMEEIIRDAKSRDPDTRRPLVAVMDGALCLWTLLASLLLGVKWVGILAYT